MRSTPKCPKCDTDMQSGWIADQSYAVTLRTRWIAGEPGKSHMFGGFRYDQGRAIALEAFRCPECGLVEFYAGGREKPD